MTGRPALGCGTFRLTFYCGSCIRQTQWSNAEVPQESSPPNNGQPEFRLQGYERPLPSLIAGSGHSRRLVTIGVETYAGPLVLASGAVLPVGNSEQAPPGLFRRCHRKTRSPGDSQESMTWFRDCRRKVVATSGNIRAQLATTARLTERRAERFAAYAPHVRLRRRYGRLPASGNAAGAGADSQGRTPSRRPRGAGTKSHY